MPRTPSSQWGTLFNFLGGGLVHMETFAEGEAQMCCQIVVVGVDDFLWFDSDLVYITFES